MENASQPFANSASQTWWSETSDTNGRYLESLVTVTEASEQHPPVGLVSDATREAVWTVYTWLMPVPCLMTVFFCLLNASVYWQQRAAPFAYYLICVDIGDGLCALMLFIGRMAFFSLPSQSLSRQIIDFYLGPYVATSCRRAAECMNLMACIERFMAVALPLKSMSKRMFGKPVGIIAAVFVLSFAGHGYYVLQYELTQKEDGSWMVTTTKLKRDNPDQFVAAATVVNFVFSYLPCFLIVVINAILLAMLRTHTASLKNVRRARGTQNSTSTPGDTVPASEPSSKGRISTTHVKEEILSSSKENSDCGKSTRAACHPNKALKEGESTTGKESGDEPRQKTGSRNENHVTKLVILFTSVFFVLALPTTISFTISSVLPNYGPDTREENMYRTVFYISYLLSHLTEPSLFWVSFAFSRHFRRTVYRLPVIRWCCGSRLNVTSSSCASSQIAGGRSGDRQKLSEISDS